MKSLIFTLVSLCTVAASAQPGADIYMTRLTCETIQKFNDYGISIKVLEGGVTGMPQLQISTMTIRGTQTETVMAQRVLSNKVGAPVVYQAPGKSLAINFTTAPIDGNYHAATWSTQSSKTAPVQVMKMKCAYVK